MKHILRICLAALFCLSICSTPVFAGGPCPVIKATTTTISTSCFGGVNGSAIVSASGGTKPYKYTWSPSGGTKDTAKNLSAGTYTVTVKDSNGCTVTATAIVYSPTQVMVNVTVVNAVSCNGGNNGCIIVCASGGTPPYSYAWSPFGDTTREVCNLSAGIYTVTVVDHNGCSGTATAAITQPSVLTATATGNNVSCVGGNNGSATATAAGGTPAYTYSWAPSGGTKATATGLTTGSYTCTITDKNGCTKSVSASVGAACFMSIISISTTAATCGSNNGSATANTSGTCPPYRYAWSNGQTNITAINLTEGTYTFTAQNSNGCTATATVVVPSGGPTVNVASSTNISCNGGNNGSANVTASGGTPPYTYAWSPSGGVGPNATGLTAGTYWCQVTDHGGCVGTTSVIITQPSLLTINFASFPTTCTNNNGAIDIIVTGGTAPYTYVWSPSGGTGANANGLSAGTYTCTITDANGCTTPFVDSVLMNGFSLSATINNINCNGGNDGSAYVTTNGGTPQYTYAWTPSGGTNSNATGLSAGTYTCTAKDSLGCTATISVTITDPASLTLTTSYTATTCGTDNGSATVTTTGGTTCSGNYSYAWAPTGGFNATANGLSAGTYTCTVTDDNGCSETVAVVVPNSNGPTVTTFKKVNVTCYGLNDGEATVSVSGGKLPYSYSWVPYGGTKDSAVGLTAGTYICSVTDSNGCVGLDVITITQPYPLTAVKDSTPCTLGCNGNAWVVPNGGTAPYTYLWNNAATTDSISGLCPAGYCCTITDAHGCKCVECFNFGPAGLNDINASEGVKVYPVPASGILNVELSGNLYPTNVIIYDMAGREIPMGKENISGSTKFTLNVSNLAEGIYLLKITGDNGQKVVRFTVLKR